LVCELVHTRKKVIQYSMWDGYESSISIAAVSGACAILCASVSCGDSFWGTCCRSGVGLRGVDAEEDSGEREEERADIPRACFLDRADALK
jgi:hypothetical protein